MMSDKKKLTIWWTAKIEYKSEFIGTEEEVNSVIHDITESDCREECLWDFQERKFEENYDAELDEYDVECIDS